MSMTKTKIDWADYTWNPVVGCRYGCPYCYAKKRAERMAGHWNGEANVVPTLTDDGVAVTDGNLKYMTNAGKLIQAPWPYGFQPTFYLNRLDYPQKIKEPASIFVCSMADLFGDWVPDEWIEQVFKACEKAPWHRYLFLTKNPKRYVKLAEADNLPQQHWYGYSATKESELWTVKHADEIPITNIFVSIEPIHGEINIAFSSHCPADWIIIGAETGNRREKVTPKREWIEPLVIHCEYSGTPLFMKNSLSGIWPEPLIQEWPF